MVDKNAEGAVGEPFEIEIERGKIYEFSRALHSEHPSYTRAEAPISPPTFLTTMFFWEARVENSNPWDLVKMSQERGVHGEQEYIFHGPPPKAGTKLTARSRIDKIFEKKGGRGGTLSFAIMVTEFRDQAGKLVAEAKLTGIETQKVHDE
jgi:hypothetical protein